MVGKDTPQACARSTCDHRSKALAAFTCSIDTFGIDIPLPVTVILSVLNTTTETETMSDSNLIEAHRPAPNPRVMRDNTLRVIDLLMGAEALCNGGEGYNEAIKALTVRANDMLVELKTDIEGMMQ